MSARRTVDRGYIKKWYQIKPARVIASDLGCQTQTVYSIAYELGLCKLSHATSYSSIRSESKPKAAPRERLPPRVIDGIPLSRLMARR